ncbi:MAG: ISNCY family transposase [Gammaproteobacteria bacterium]
MDVMKMSRKERERLEVFGRVKRGELSLVKGAELLCISYRQALRVYQRYRQNGSKGLTHRSRGRVSNRAKPVALKQAVLARYQESYGDFGPTLAAEHLHRDGYAVDHETLRRWLIAEGLWQKRRRRRVHRRWRARKEYLGEMVQMDGSEHDWFEGRRGRAVLMVLIDDATNRTSARFYESETTAAAFDVFGRYVRQYGLPRSLYVDRDSIYRTTRDATAEEALDQTGPETQFSRAMRQLSVQLMCARSPQAKGRVERRHAVFQDRLVKELRLAGILELEKANEFLEEQFLPELNRRFTVAAARFGDLHRRVGRGLKLDELLCFEEHRVVQRDWSVSWRGRYFQLAGESASLGLVGRKITVREKLDGTIQLVHNSRALRHQELPERPRMNGAEAAQAECNRRSPSPARGPWKPAADHPWRRGWNGRAKLRATGSD